VLVLLGQPRLILAVILAPVGAQPFVDGVGEDVADATDAPEGGFLTAGNAGMVQPACQIGEAVRPRRIGLEQEPNGCGLVLQNEILAEKLGRLFAAQHIGLRDNFVAERAVGPRGLQPLLGAADAPAHGALLDDLALVLGKAALNGKVQVAFGRVRKVHVAEDEPPAGALHGLLDGLLVLHVPAIAAQVRADQRIRPPGLDVAEGRLHPLPREQETAGDGRVIILGDDGQAQGQRLRPAGVALGLRAGPVLVLFAAGNAGVKDRPVGLAEWLVHCFSPLLRCGPLGRFLYTSVPGRISSSRARTSCFSTSTV